MAVRTLAKGEEARAEILAGTRSAQLEVRRIDLADLASRPGVRRRRCRRRRPVDLLINNAGVMAPPTRMTTADGFELQFGSNFLGPFALTDPAAAAGPRRAGPRVVTMSSGTANFGRIRFDDLQWERRYSPTAAYAQSKLADLLFARHLAEVAGRSGWDLLTTLAHPGYTRTNLQTAGASLGRDQAPPAAARRPHPRAVAGGRAGHRAAAVRRHQPRCAITAATTGPAGSWDWSARPGRRGSREAREAPTWRHRCGRSPRT